MSTQETESEYGVSVILHSSANKNMFKFNKPTRFTNIFKKPLKLNESDEYEVCLGNVHIPSFHSVLVKNDFDRSNISFNLGMFLYNKSTGKWDLLNNSKRELWNLAPTIDFEGLDENYITSSQKTDYLTKIFDSLSLGSHTNTNENCLELFLNTVSRKTGSFTKKIIEEYKPDDDDSIWFKTLPVNMIQEDRYDFFEKLMRVLSIDPIEYVKHVVHSFKPNEKRFIEKTFNKIKSDNSESLTRLRELYYNDLYSSLWEDKKKRKDENESDDNTPIIAAYISFGDRMSKFLSMDENSIFFIGYCGFSYITPFDSNQLPIPVFERATLDTLFIYSDLVAHSVRVGSHLTNLLGIVTVNKKNLTNMVNPLHIFRPLSHKYYQSASVHITDQNGDEIEFEKDSFSVLEIVIKKREKI